MHLIVLEKHQRGLFVPPRRHLFRFDDGLSEVDVDRMQAILTRAPDHLSPLAAERVLRELQGVAPLRCLLCNRAECAELLAEDLVEGATVH
jgi:hypothetical protein